MLCCSVSDFDFLGPYWQKKGVAATPAHKGLGPQNKTKKLAHVGVLLGHLLSQNHVPKDYHPPIKTTKNNLGAEKNTTLTQNSPSHGLW